MITVTEAQAAVLHECHPLPAQAVPLEQGVGRILAETIRSDIDSPPFAKSMMDGYAVRTADVVSAPCRLTLIGELTAGGVCETPLQPGQALRIMTGAPIPPGADAVVRLEDTTPLGETAVRVDQAVPSPGLNLIPRGQMLRAGEVVLAPGRRLRAQELALAAELGRAVVQVFAAPRVAVLATGDELVPPGEPLGPGQIRNSNETLLLAQATAWGCHPIGLGIARDNEPELRAKIAQGLAADILILTGGVSLGTKDLVPRVLTELGVRTVFHKVQLKPGKPVWFGVRDPGGEPADRAPGAGGTQRSRLIFALPGNPVSSMVCSELFIRPAVARLTGATVSENAAVAARLTCQHSLCEDRPTYFPARLEFLSSGAAVTPTDWKGSADLRATTDANAMIAFPPGQRTYAAGELVDVVPWTGTGG